MKNAGFKMSDFATASASEREDMIKTLIEACHDPENIRLGRIALENEVQAYETKFGMTSEEMFAKLSCGKMEETEEVCDWCMAYHRLEMARKSSKKE